MSDTKKERLVLVDALAVLFRAYFALPPMSSPSGEPTNAVYGFTRILLNVIDELEPTCLCIAFDSPGASFREDIYPEYKANRDEAPADFKPQIPITQRVVDAMNIPRFELPKWEADDIVGTLAEQASKKFEARNSKSEKGEVILVTGDQDFFQLVDDKKNIKVFIPGMRGKESILYGEAEVIGKMGVKNTQITDYKGLAGDSSDNIPGIRGIGPKTAVGLLAENQSLEDLYKKIDSVINNEVQLQVTSDKRQDLKEFSKELGISNAVLMKLVRERENAFLSKELATISREADISIDLDHCQLSVYDKTDVRKIFEELNFKSLLSRLPDDQFDVDVQEALF